VSLLAELRGIIDGASAQLTEQDKALAERLMLRYSELIARKVSGDNVDDDIRVVMATLGNIKAGVYGSLANEVRNVIIQFFTRILTAATVIP
jgi:hypothetical protein